MAKKKEEAVDDRFSALLPALPSQTPPSEVETTPSRYHVQAGLWLLLFFFGCHQNLEGSTVSNAEVALLIYPPFVPVAAAAWRAYTLLVEHTPPCPALAPSLYLSCQYALLLCEPVPGLFQLPARRAFSSRHCADGEGKDADAAVTVAPFCKGMACHGGW